MQIVLVLLSVLLTLLILMHRGKGGGLSDMFGGGLTQNAGTSGVAEKNLNRWTVIIALLWVAIVIALGPDDQVRRDLIGRIPLKTHDATASWVFSCFGDDGGKDSYGHDESEQGGCGRRRHRRVHGRIRPGPATACATRWC